jgi:hypothetical protein
MNQFQNARGFATSLGRENSYFLLLTECMLKPNLTDHSPLRFPTLIVHTSAPPCAHAMHGGLTMTRFHDSTK